MIRIEHLHKTYPLERNAKTAGTPVAALSDINLHIKKGEIFGIIGRSGAGKSTLIRTLNMLERPSSGQVLIEGEDITALDNNGLHRLRQRIGMIFQHFNLLNAKESQIDYFYVSRLRGEPAEGVGDIHFHPVEPAAFRVTLSALF